MSNPYPNNFYSNPVEPSKEQLNDLKRKKYQSVKEMPILQVLDDYLTEAITQTDSIKQLKIDLSKPAQDLASQMLALQLLEKHLINIQSEVKRRINLVQEHNQD